MSDNELQGVLTERSQDIGQSEETAPPQSADESPRLNRGWFKPGNVQAVSHALFSERDLANLNAEVTAFLEQAVADDGGESEISARRKALLVYRARVHRRIVQLDNAIEARGLLDGRGKLRVAWLQALQGLIVTAKGIDSLLGLERRQRQIDVAEQFARMHQEREARK